MITEKALVVVHMVTYNHENYITEAIESVMMQRTSFHYKLFIGEDYSTDKTRKICLQLKSKYPDKIELFLNQSNIGGALNSIKLLEACFKHGSKYIALLEGDDFWNDSYKLQKQVDFLELNPKFVCHCHNAIIIENDEIKRLYNDNKTDKSLNTDDLITNLGIPTASVLFRNCLQALPPYMQKFSLDTILYFALSKFGDFYQSTEVMSAYRIHDGGLWTGQNILQKMNENIKIKRYYLQEIPLSKLQKKMVKQLIVNIKLNRLKYFANTQFLSLNYFKDLIYLIHKKFLAYRFSLKFFIFCMLPENFIKLFKR